MTTITAIIIDPIARVIDKCEIESIDGSTYDGLRDLVFKHREQPGYLEAIRVGANHSIYIDEEGVFFDWDHQGFFRMRQGDRESDPIAGVAVMVSDTPDGDVSDCWLPLDLIRSSIEWIEPRQVRVKAPFMTSFNDKGEEEKTLLAGVEEWTYYNQPN